jgi:RecA/RadA recombinase
MSLLKQLTHNKEFSTILQNVKDFKVRDYISTGAYALNGILSGNVNVGIPSNTICCLAGESNSGKTFVLANMVKSAIDLGYEALIFDSERAVREDYYARVGCDLDKIFRVPVGSSMDFRNKAYKIIEEYYKNSGKENKLFVALDSLGNLASEKELVDAEKEKSAADQGNNAKAQNSAFRVVSSLASQYDFPFVFTNHVYANIGDMFAQRGVISGGAKSVYNSSVILYFERLVNKEEGVDIFGKEKKIDVGMKMKITTIKNREYKENISVCLNLRYDTGINPYSGLLDFAIRAGVIENKPRGYLITATGKTVYDADLYTPEVFTSDALAKINDWLSKNGYSSMSDVFSSDVAKSIQDIGVDNVEEETASKKKK